MATRSDVFLVLMGTMLNFVAISSTEKTLSPVPDIQQSSLLVTPTIVVSPSTTLVSSFQHGTQGLLDSSTSQTTNARPMNHSESSAVMSSAIYSSLNATIQPSSAAIVMGSMYSTNQATLSEVTPTTSATLNLFNQTSSPASYFFNISSTFIIDDVLNMSGSMRVDSSIHHNQWLSSTLQPSSSFFAKMQTTVVHSTGRLTLDLSAFSDSPIAAADFNMTSPPLTTTSVLGYISHVINTHPSVIVSPTITVLAPAQNGEQAKVGRTGRMTSGAKAAIGIVIALCLLGVIVAGVVVYRK